MSKVVLIRCESYDETKVREAVTKGLNYLGGPGQFARSGEKILLKPNLLVAEVPEKCVTTHPSVFKAVAEAFLTTGATISYGDSPAIGSTQKAVKKCGLLEVAEALDLTLADFKNGEKIFFEQGVQNKNFFIAKAVLENDAVISLPKLKTHALERMTGSIKNQFGCIPGVLKGEYHVKIPDAHDFGRMLVDLNNYVHPRLYLMDGITAMEGNGPRGGTPKQMNVLLFSDDPVALDAVVCRMVGISPEYVPTIKFGMETGAGTYLEDEIELLGDDFSSFVDDQFLISRKPIDAYTKTGIQRFVKNRLVSKPVILSEKCTSCGTCVSMCPVDPKALNWDEGDKDKPPIYNYTQCIRCYCCQELCPESAIELKKPIFRKFLDLFI